MGPKEGGMQQRLVYVSCLSTPCTLLPPLPSCLWDACLHGAGIDTALAKGNLAFSKAADPAWLCMLPTLLPQGPVTIHLTLLFLSVLNTHESHSSFPSALWQTLLNDRHWELLRMSSLNSEMVGSEDGVNCSGSHGGEWNWAAKHIILFPPPAAPPSGSQIIIHVLTLNSCANLFSREKSWQSLAIRSALLFLQGTEKMLLS